MSWEDGRVTEPHRVCDNKDMIWQTMDSDGDQVIKTTKNNQLTPASNSNISNRTTILHVVVLKHEIRRESNQKSLGPWLKDLETDDNLEIVASSMTVKVADQHEDDVATNTDRWMSRAYKGGGRWIRSHWMEYKTHKRLKVTGKRRLHEKTKKFENQSKIRQGLSEGVDIHLLRQHRFPSSIGLCGRCCPNRNFDKSYF